MTVFDIPNIEHCDVVAVGTVAYRVNTHTGWYIHKPMFGGGADDEGNPTKNYKTSTIIRVDEDMTGIEITAEADLPDNAVINEVGSTPEIM